jgi:hypothetical protein
VQDVLQWSAACTVSANDTFAIQAAINAAGKTSSAGIVDFTHCHVLNTGTITISAPVTLRLGDIVWTSCSSSAPCSTSNAATILNINSPNVRIEGAGMGRTILKLADGAASSSSAVIGTPIPIGNNFFSGIVIRDLTIDGDRAGNSSIVGNYGVYLQQVSDVLIERVEVRHLTGTGIDIFNGAERNSVRDSWVWDYGVPGFGTAYRGIAVERNNAGYTEAPTVYRDFVNALPYGNEGMRIGVSVGTMADSLVDSNTVLLGAIVFAVLECRLVPMT